MRVTSERTLLAVFTLAGALAVPLHPVWTVVSAAVGGLVGMIGIRLWRWSGLAERVEASRGGAAAAGLRYGLWMVLGLGVGLVLLAIIRLVIEPVVPAAGARIAAAGRLPLWRRAAIIYEAAVGEELVFRLILLSTVAGLVVRLRRLPGRLPDRPALWMANAAAALAFGLAHVPAWMGVAPGLRGLAAIVVGLNAAAGLLLGYVFGTRGIGAAIWTHAGADCAIQLIGPLTG